ncbi:MAG TPA: NAD-dependent succinate-semialdehyde dehydrogenase [Conexibacter sp.]|jgi:acyl-CoA reductase-like NAD-dependent aldehyde dehydrogenase
MTTDVRSHVESIDPATGDVLERYPLHDGAAVDAALERAHRAQLSWRDGGFEHRAQFLRAVASELRGAVDELAELITAEMGKTLREARGEVEKSAWVCEHYADNGARQLAPEVIATDWSETYVDFPPLGTVLAIMPWNYPVWQVMRAAAPALMAGNTMVLKHASNVTGSALALAELIGIVQPSLFEALVISSGDVADVIRDPRIDAVTLTGSEAVGIKVATVCAEVLKPSVLELGGSDPFIVLEDADVEAAAEMAVKARFSNTGQSCVAGKRFIVVDAVADAFEQAFAAKTGALVMGAPRDAVDVGPMARVDLRDELADQVARGVQAGGRVLVGGAIPDGPGAFYAPTVVGGVEADNPLAREETFGPAAAVLRVRDERHAVELANDSPYGLSSSLWTGDIARAKRITPHIEAGAVFVNTMTASDPRVPFGGVKRSGWGRELGDFGIREFVNAQSITIAPKR